MFMVNLLHKNIFYGDIMNRILKLTIPLLVLSILLSSCAFNNTKKTLEQINTYISENKFNDCLLFVKELENEEKAVINNNACNIVINKFIELRNKTKIDETNIFDLSLIDTSFAENCQKLWNIISEFSLDNKYEFYSECVNLRYYSEMINFTRYCTIYDLAKKANNIGYLDNLSFALYEYDSKGDNSKLKLLYDDINGINYNSYNPQHYLVTDFRNAHERIVKAMVELNDGFSANDSVTVATAITSLKGALTDILFITDTLFAVNTMQKTIYNKVLTDNIYAPFDSDIKITKRDYINGIKFELNTIFGGIENIEDNSNNVESTTTPNGDNVTMEEAIKIATSAINKTKAFTGDVNITLIQTRNIKLTAFETNSQLLDAENMIKTKLNQVINQSNGIGKKTTSFSNGKNSDKTLNSYIPPSNKSASLNIDAVNKYTCIKGSGGYVITFELKPELVESKNKVSNIGSIVNTFEFDNSENVKDFDTSYSPTSISLIINNSGKLIEMEYTIDGISNCEFQENNGKDSYKTQFTFKNNYKYEFKY